jgi:hypothetical protein
MCPLGGHWPPTIVTLGTAAIWTSRCEIIGEGLDRINRQYLAARKARVEDRRAKWSSRVPTPTPALPLPSRTPKLGHHDAPVFAYSQLVQKSRHICPSFF